MKSKLCRFLAFTCCLTLLFAPAAIAQKGEVDTSQTKTYHTAETIDVVVPFVFEGDLRELPATKSWGPGDAIKEIPKRANLTPSVEPKAQPFERDPLLDQQAAAAPSKAQKVFTSTIVNVDGMGFTGVNPPDTVGDVGMNYFIQMINGGGGALFTVHDKTNGAVVAGPTALETLGSGNCASGLGDPIALYDEDANRWFLSEFSSSGNLLCLYVSQTSDPLAGGWFSYQISATNFPDYPKWGVWPDAYYVTTNENAARAYAIDRAAMLAGNPASVQQVSFPALAGFGFQALTPADVDGDFPPAGSPNYIMRHRDDESHNGGSAIAGQDFLEVWELSIDFNNASNSSLTGPLNIAVAEFDSSLCGLTSFNCIRQPGTSTTLDPLREVVMFRLAYRNFGSYEVLLGNLAIDVSGSDDSGIRWFELRKSGGGGWGLFQEGTYAPDGDSRWMGASAMDVNGNIAVGYNVSSSSTFPGLRYAGRLDGDAAGTLPQGEANIVTGTASNASNRYGDYASLSVDPADGCTFWFTGEYNAASQWSTRIASFRFDSCQDSCGNGVIDAGEVCDGGLLGGATCGSEFGCSGGTLSCNSSCSGYDFSACTGCPAICGNGTCESGEDCNTCAADCPSFTAGGASCGNGICEAGDGENCLNCAADCNGRQGGKPSNRFCCGDGAGTNPVSCGDSRCSSGGNSCTTVPAPSGTSCCGDFICEGSETSLNCGLDCGACTITETPELTCDDLSDNDCDGFIDCDDSDCAGSSACNGGGCTLAQVGDSCVNNSDCCSNKCKGPNGGKTCK